MAIETKELIAFIGILVTMLLGIYNALQNHRNSKRTSFINTVTSERVKWIEKLRQSISTFCGLAHTLHCSVNQGADEELKVIEEINKLRHLIMLQLNPHSGTDQDIQRLVGKIASMSTERVDVSNDEFQLQLERLISKTQELLKAEWEKVKIESVRGELSQ